MQILKKFLFLLNNHERKRVSILLVMILIMALLDMIGVASILPFIAVLTDPGIVETNMILKQMYHISNIFGVENNQQFLFTLGIFVFLVLVISLVFKAITTYVMVLFVQMLEYSICKRLVQGYLTQPYTWFLNRNSADLGKTVLSEVSELVGNGIRPLMELISKGMIAIIIIILLIIVNPKLALIIGLMLGGAYGLIFYFIKSFLIKIGKARLRNNESRFTVLSEVFGAAKEVKLGGLEETYIKRFSGHAHNTARYYSLSKVLGELPRHLLEAIAFGGILLMILLLLQTESFNNMLPIISLYVFAGYRLMPALQNIYNSFTKITFVGPSLNKLHDDIKGFKPFIKNKDQDILILEKKITLKNICYDYPNSSRTALRDINMNIPAKHTIGLIGSTGSGKTTTVDIILGLLEAQKGNLEIDGKIITKNNCRAWQRSLGYVPQHIYLADDTIEANIAFGSPPEEIDREAVEKSAKIANLYEFVVNELPEKFQTKVGERGIRLSLQVLKPIRRSTSAYWNCKGIIP